MTASPYLTFHTCLLISLTIYLKRWKLTLTRRRRSPCKEAEPPSVVAPSWWEIAVHTAGWREPPFERDRERPAGWRLPERNRMAPLLCSQPPAPHNPEWLPCAWGAGEWKGSRREAGK